MKIYKVYNGKLVETEARETAKQYIITGERSLSFDYRKNIHKDEAHTIPIAAINAEKQSALAYIKKAQTDLMKANLRYDAAIDLENALQ